MSQLERIGYNRVLKGCTILEHSDACHYEGNEQYALGLGLPEARRWAVEKIIEAVDRNKVEWFPTDTAL